MSDYPREFTDEDEAKLQALEARLERAEELIGQMRPFLFEGGYNELAALELRKEAQSFLVEGR